MKHCLIPRIRPISKQIIITILAFFGCLFFAHANENPYEDGMDPYHWMETHPQQTARWLNQRSNQTVKTLHALPWRNALAKRLSELENTAPTISDIYDAGQNRFYLRSTVEHPYLRLFVRQKGKPERVLIDPPVGYGINFFSPSHDGRYVAFGLSRNGTESTRITVIRVVDNVVLDTHIPDVRYPSVVWAADNQSFYYSLNTITQDSGRQTCSKVYLHRIGHDRDVMTFDWRTLPELAQKACENVNLYTSPDSEYLIVNVSKSISGYGGYLFAAKKDADDNSTLTWNKIVDTDKNVSAFVYSGKWIYLASYNASSGYDISRINLAAPASTKEPVMSWSNGELTQLSLSRDSLYVAYHNAGSSKFMRIPFADIRNHQAILVPADEDVSAIFASSDSQDILFTRQGWLNPPVIYHYQPADNIIQKTELIPPLSQPLTDYVTEEKWVTTAENVRVPLTLIYRKGIARDGSVPTWLTAYGAYGVSTFPSFDLTRLLWLEQGGILAIAHVRGGGEMGPDWHEAGRADKKENSITDFIRCAEYLIDSRYTSPSKLAIGGESAGGIIVGMAMTRRPELFSAVAIDAGMLNTSRLDNIPIGVMNYDELGSPLTPSGRLNLLKIDAYRHLVPEKRYPPVLLTVGLHDQRVSPWQTAKFAARLEEIGSPRSVLVLAYRQGGHSAATYAEADSKLVDTVSFFIWKTGLHVQDR
ncbi:prolyl oligopeptidase family serine peptidase [Enterobacter quasiroggenkampii]|uniref:prolyl oligopeptidase family serine peptidase n=1 Tax=Enterobacter quasiroggenkampii TaxID=2497436 RepID=UPI0021D0E5F1|nr:prolyl oligopeptidase family serine peptidase [Enterobacter quasiroggenkampii]MCU6306579.1 prolyl oligopeptidase family serine peptidase [Enterobacter quasiroggenkampii]